jgi:hypothetical protein
MLSLRFCALSEAKGMVIINYAKIIAAPYLKNKSLIHMEYVKEGLVFFVPQNITFKDKLGRKTYLPYPAGITPGLATSPWEKGFFLFRTGKRYISWCAIQQSFIFLTPRQKRWFFWPV